MGPTPRPNPPETPGGGTPGGGPPGSRRPDEIGPPHHIGGSGPPTDGGGCGRGSEGAGERRLLPEHDDGSRSPGDPPSDAPPGGVDPGDTPPGFDLLGARAPRTSDGAPATGAPPASGGAPRTGLASPPGSVASPPGAASRESWQAWASWGSLGMEFAAGIVVFFLLGSWADARWGTDPWLRLAGAFVGIVLGTYLLIKKALATTFTDRRDSNDRRGEPPRQGS